MAGGTDCTPEIKLRSRRAHPFLRWGLWSLGALIVAFVPFYYHTYMQYIADTRNFFDEYMSLRQEIDFRENGIARQILKAKSISEMRKTIDERKYFSPKYKEITIAELQRLYVIDSESVDETGINKSFDDQIKQSPLYKKYARVFYGDIDEKISDADLKDLQILASNIVYSQFY